MIKKSVAAVILGLIVFSSCNEFEKNFTIHKHMITRGGWQWIMVAENDSFMCINLNDSLKKDKKSAKLKFEFTGKMDTLYQVGPVDFPVYYKSVPQIKILK